jgi:hypothetical protein
MDMKEILEKLDDLIAELESLITEADNENPDQTFISGDAKIFIHSENLKPSSLRRRKQSQYIFNFA